MLIFSRDPDIFTKIETPASVVAVENWVPPLEKLVGTGHLLDLPSHGNSCYYRSAYSTDIHGFAEAVKVKVAVCNVFYENDDIIINHDRLTVRGKTLESVLSQIKITGVDALSHWVTFVENIFTQLGPKRTCALLWKLNANEIKVTQAFELSVFNILSSIFPEFVEINNEIVIIKQKDLLSINLESVVCRLNFLPNGSIDYGRNFHLMSYTSPKLINKYRYLVGQRKFIATEDTNIQNILTTLKELIHVRGLAKTTKIFTITDGNFILAYNNIVSDNLTAAMYVDCNKLTPEVLLKFNKYVFPYVSLILYSGKNPSNFPSTLELPPLPHYTIQVQTSLNFPRYKGTVMILTSKLECQNIKCSYNLIDKPDSKSGDINVFLLEDREILINNMDTMSHFFHKNDYVILYRINSLVTLKIITNLLKINSNVVFVE